MVRIEGHWERIETLEDISRIIREYYSHELADELDELIPSTREAEELQMEVDMLRDKVESQDEILDEIVRLVRYGI